MCIFSLENIMVFKKLVSVASIIMPIEKNWFILKYSKHNSMENSQYGLMHKSCK